MKDSHDTKYCAQKGGKYENNLKGARLAERLAQQQRHAAKTQSSLAHHMKNKDAGKEDSDEDSSGSRIYGCFANFKTTKSDVSANESDSDDWEDASNETHGRKRKKVHFADEDGELLEEDVINFLREVSTESYDQHDDEPLMMGDDLTATEYSSFNILADRHDLDEFCVDYDENDYTLTEHSQLPRRTGQV